MVFSDVHLGVPNVDSLQISNVVLHGRQWKSHSTPFSRNLFRTSIKKKDDTLPLNSVFRLGRVKSKSLGTILQFETQNAIRAGPTHSHSAAFLSLVKYRRMRGQRNTNFTAIGCPNVVVNGCFTRALDFPKVKTLPHASYSDKFPGIAITAPPSVNANGSTVEVYRAAANGKSRFIIAGTRCPHSLKRLLLFLSETLPFEPDPSSPGAGCEPSNL